MTATLLGVDANDLHTRTDKHGRATFPLPAAGAWRIEAVHMIKARGAVGRRLGKFVGFSHLRALFGRVDRAARRGARRRLPQQRRPVCGEGATMTVRAAGPVQSAARSEILPPDVLASIR